MIEKKTLESYYTEGQKAHRPNRKLFEKHEKKVKVGMAKQKVLEAKKK